MNSSIIEIQKIMDVQFAEKLPNQIKQLNDKTQLLIEQFKSIDKKVL